MTTQGAFPIPTIVYTRDPQYNAGRPERDVRFNLDFGKSTGLMAFDTRSRKMGELAAAEIEGKKGSRLIVAPLPIPGDDTARLNATVNRYIYMPPTTAGDIQSIPVGHSIGDVIRGDTPGVDGQAPTESKVDRAIRLESKPLLVAALREEGLTKKDAEAEAKRMMASGSKA